MRLNFVVKGSQGDHYEVLFERAGENLNAFCSCPAGVNGQYCKHRFALMNGEVESLIVGSDEDLRALREMIRGTDLELAYREMIAAENEHAKTKRVLDAAKKNVARAMFR